ncbi:predicted protein [Nematostella vectensis]|uniref:Uncharacterized protein n=1 Tax=Nematostella vectensis TaxID=45351 RepID=A7S266_NEMVE|nr:predicted protein [Nematostella vectensis]|eukprot:XP_001634295.1 predicted protein [Nematostella vectensis]
MATEKSVEKRKPTREGEYKKLDLFIQVVGIGNDGVGKTCLVKNFCEKKFSKSYHQTVGVDYGFKLHKIHGVEYRINFWDFGGDPDYNEIRSELYGQTQIDLISRRVISSKEGQKWARAQDLKYYETSSANGQGVYEMFNDLLVTVIDRKLLRAKPVVTLDKDGKMK